MRFDLKKIEKRRRIGIEKIVDLNAEKIAFICGVECYMRGQVSLEFILVVVFLLALITMLLPTANALADQISSLDELVAAKGALNAVASAIDYVVVSGDGARMHVDVYVPKNVHCFVDNSLNCTLKACKRWEAKNEVTFCGELEVLNVSSTPFYSVSDLKVQNCDGKTGWVPVDVYADGSSIVVQCGEE